MEQLSDDMDLIQGADYSFIVPMSTSAGPLINYSGKFIFTLKRLLTDSDANAVLQIINNFTTDSNGNMPFDITSTQTNQEIGTYWYGVTVIAGGKSSKSFPGRVRIRLASDQETS